ncbi:MAG TPA: AI-2E family transporter [Thermoanaerobaculia bacterium]|nr:AI-2E family transporter [Thermoanaerobaculia bacterium]
MRDTKVILVLLAVLVFFAVGFLLGALESILLPFIIAVFLGKILAPLMTALRRRRVPDGASIVLVLLLVSAGLFLFGWMLYSTAESFARALPRYEARLSTLVSDASGWLSSTSPVLAERLEKWRWDEAVEVSSLTGFVAATLGSFLIFFNDAFLILLFLVFLLAGSDSFPRKLEHALTPERAGRVGTVLRNIDGEVRKYLLMKTLANLLNGALVTILLASFGVDFPLLWGFLTFLSHYIPNLGAVLSVGLPAVFFFLQFESPGRALLVAVLNLALQFVIGNVVEPRLMGSSLDLSPLLVLASLIFWGWLWGPWGMILAVPITSTIKIICANIEPLRPLAVLMSGETSEIPAAAPAPAAPAEAAPVA